MAAGVAEDVPEHLALYSMNLPKFSVGRPVFTVMVFLIVIVLGLVSLRELQIDLLPSVELTTVSVRTSYPGASPEVMENQVTRILEEIVAIVPGIVEMNSTSSEGSSSIRINFAWGTDINAAAISVQAAIEDELNELPADVERPQVRKFDVDSFPVVILGISSPIDRVELNRLVENQIRNRFTRIPGVAQVDIWGGFQREIRVELDPERIKALEMPLDQILDALRAANIDLPAGRIEEGRFEFSVRSPARFESVSDIENTIVGIRRGAAVRVGDVAQVVDTHQRRNREIRVNGQRGIRVAIRKEAGANTVEVSSAVLRMIEETNREFPGVSIVPVFSQGNFIEQSIANVSRSVLYGGGLAVLVLLFFLRNLRSTIVISLAIPISIIATFAMIYFGGFTINLMTLGGLALGVGMMVDSSIVVLENIFRRRDEDGEPPVAASASGAWEVAPAIIASTLTTLVIFLPLVFVEGVAGMLFRDLGYVVAFALICSLVVSLSLVPMMASRFIKPKGYGDATRQPWMQRIKVWSDERFHAIDLFYRGVLEGALLRPGLVVVGAVCLFALSIYLVRFVGSEFLPPSDEGDVRIFASIEEGTRLDLTDRQTRLIEEVVYNEIPELVSSVVDVRQNRSSVTIKLTPVSERSRSNVEIADDLRRRLSGNIPGMRVSVQAPQGQFLLERLLGGGAASMNVEIYGPDMEVLNQLADRVTEVVEMVPGVTHVDFREVQGTPQREFYFDREKIADLGLSPRDVSRVFQTAIAGSRVGVFESRGEAMRIVVQMRDAEQLSVDEILDLTVTARTGEAVALRNVVETDLGRAPRSIQRKNQQRIVSVSANVSGRDLGSVAAEVERALGTIVRPAEYELRVAGNYEEQKKSAQQLLISIIMAIALVYMVLACQYESLRDPLIVMLAIPMAGIGVVLTLILTETTLNLQSGIGCIMLIGIVVNNAILLVDQGNRLLKTMPSVQAAVLEAGRRRLRPILMTTFTTILGLTPLALGIGEGADAQAPLARVVVGGLIGSTLITLILIPAVFYLVYRSRDLQYAGKKKETAAIQ